MKTFKTVIGIDISKDQLDNFELQSEEGNYKQVLNRPKPIEQWVKTLDASRTLCVLEATGCYGSHLMYYLTKYGISYTVVNPLQSDGYAKALGIISKDDRQASRCLAMMGKNLALPLYQYPSETMQKRKQLLMGINALKKQQRMLSNQLHALDHQVIFEPQVVVALKNTLSTVEEQLQHLEQQLIELSDQDDDEYRAQLSLLKSVVGIGNKIANLLLAATGGLQNFSHPRQLSKFVGLVPSSHYSGSSVRKNGKITKRGNGSLRAALYMGARSAKMHNKSCKDLYERLRQKGKPHKQAMVAVMNKLIKQAFGVVHSGDPFDNLYYLKYSTN